MTGLALPPIREDTDVLTLGESTMHRRQVSSTSVVTGTGSLRLAYFTAKKTEMVTQLRIITGGTAAAATPTLCRVGWYSVAANGNLTLVGAIANDTTLFANTITAYTRSLVAPFLKVAGQRYAVGPLVVTGAAAPTMLGHNALTTAEAGMAPKLGGLVAGQADLPASVVAASVSDGAHMPYVVLLP